MAEHIKAKHIEPCSLLHQLQADRRERRQGYFGDFKEFGIEMPEINEIVIRARSDDKEDHLAAAIRRVGDRIFSSSEDEESDHEGENPDGSWG